MTACLKVACATLAIRRYGAFADFAGHMRSLVEAAASGGADLLLLPELACVGLLWTDRSAGRIAVPDVGAFYDATLTPLQDAYRRTLSELAARSGIVIAGASFWHREGGIGRNSAFVFHPSGKIDRQDKLHPTRPERAIGTEGGSAIRVFEVAGIRCGIAVCYDVQFPELVRCFADTGVEAVLVPSLTDERGYWRVRHGAHARAVENQLFVCVSPLVGDLGIPFDHPVRGHGEAYVACPIDNRFGIADGTYARGQRNEEEVLQVSLDLDLLRLSRARAEIRPLSDRRADLYPSLIARREAPAPQTREDQPCRPKAATS